MPLQKIRNRLEKLASKDTAAILQRFFKTGPGEYGEGDVFIGIKIPPLRLLAKDFSTAPFHVIKALLTSEIHEERTLALMILTDAFAKAEEPARERIYNFYLRHIRFINNWDLVDGSAPYIVGPFLWQKNSRPLYIFAESDSLWERRIAILSTFYFIRQNDFADTLKISERLLNDKEDLMHKAVGWMLREVGKRDLNLLETFLKKHYQRMPRTALRYAIEKFPEPRRQKYLCGKM